ncbi:hypothetical protein [Saccharothrix luteola]|uniref:hypothetical protein n=1 Tax=Saccharothrix luteola TaxID=2893018 RepID=UPI001E505091|nr:hypothetical protein [Saccharothrix luteola]MCC8250110.1 hypothetical protein [Saccharothrix luteola]
MFTIGHSVHDLANLVRLLRRHDAGIEYAFLGKELGARTEDLSCYVDGRVQHDVLAKTPDFVSGLERLQKGSRTERLDEALSRQESRIAYVNEELRDDGVTEV